MKKISGQNNFQDIKTDEPVRVVIPAKAIGPVIL
jgi:hypothetical protein